MINGKHHCQWDQLPRRAVGTEKGHWLSHCGFRFSFSHRHHPLIVFCILSSLLCWLYFVCLCFKRSIFFLSSPYLSLFQCTPTTPNKKQKEQESQNATTFSKNPVCNNKFSAFEKKEKKNQCLPHFLPSMLQDLSFIPHFPFTVFPHFSSACGVNDGPDHLLLTFQHLGWRMPTLKSSKICGLSSCNFSAFGHSVASWWN